MHNYHDYKSLFLEIVNEVKQKHLMQIKQFVTKYKEQFLEYIDCELCELNYELSIAVMIKNSVENFIKVHALKIKDVFLIVLDELDEFVDLTNSAINELEDLIFRKSAKLIYQEITLNN